MALFTIVIVVAVLRLAAGSIRSAGAGDPAHLPARADGRAAAAVGTSTAAWRSSSPWRLALTLIGGLGDVVFNQFSDLAHELPSYQRQLRDNLTAPARRSCSGGMAETTQGHGAAHQGDRSRRADVTARSARVPKVQVVEPPATHFETLRERRRAMSSGRSARHWR